MADAHPPKSEEVLLVGRFAFQEPALWFPKVRLFADRLELTGWRLPGGRYRRRIPLHRILQVDADGPECLLVWLADGRSLRLRLDEAPRWQRTIRRRLGDEAT